MNRSTIETFVGAFVLLAAVLFVFLSWSVVDHRSSGKIIKAEFGDISGLSVGDDVKVSGITIGEVVANKLDFQNYVALVELNIDKGINLPDDSIARIASSSLLGGHYVDIIPGISDVFLKHEEIIYNTRDSVSLIDLLGQAVFSSTE